ncbi:DUF2007 domain-containing protein [Bordetella avium]|uniref:putative signal transducing protein n=1 Tax=Bordetella avium TaxID=521 RepID=UPI000E694A80|nr:DUF2007 domain-containing protein [Bordetella avium]RIQ16593.1 DUF2007 domain-containing protein [Bordetella avium]RIQ31353.1 DUF2007 domain-containing protein [Bordetella avium]
MYRLVRAPSLLLAQHWLNLLCQARVSAELHNQHLQGVMGEIPVDQCGPEIWIERESDRDFAMRLIGLEPAAEAAALPWTCPRCAEVLEAQFSECWRCGAERP